MCDPVENNEHIFSPIIYKSFIPPCFEDGMLYGLHSPVIGVYGTSPKQGKFLLQLELRREFIKRGYSVGQVGTEPEALLFDFDSIYPMGYNSSVSISGYDAIFYINRMMYEVESNRDIDLIITGSQSGTVPASFGRLRNMTLPQIEFLFGTCPDVVVLSINLFDEVEYISRNIKLIEGAVDTKFVALVVFPSISQTIAAG